ncbi:enoyl-CoA hydratase/isomerase family protein [Lacisediminimonas profundi]|uniref:enoyl-CoA hydratase/isomerase family protein n=1 Tax=Lacisediminimonas profundi TaxID=2603856 RepID=UPI00124B5242|nr:enoyl-CoA hydratase/isomerase family protein [Lacisediminimonas profundi]
MGQVTYEVRDNVAEIMLNQAPVNALTKSIITDVLDGLSRAAADDEVRAVILGSAVPGVFCAGLNLQKVIEGTDAEARGLLELLYVRMTDLQFGLGKPSIAAVTGGARAGGMTMAISCDMIIAGRSSTFGYPEIDVGIIPAIHFTHLPRIIGKPRAFDLLFTGRSFDADEAQSLGLVSRVVDDDQVLAEARKLGQVFAAKPASIMRMGRNAFMTANDNGYRQGVAVAVENLCNVMATDDAREGFKAYMGKRRPRWAVKRSK